MMKNLIIWCWKHHRPILSWLIFLSFTSLVVSYTLAAMHTELFSKTWFLSDTSTQGHYQIEEKCGLCHSAFSGVPQSSCVDCHGKALKQANDSHSAKKFRDPRNAEDLEKINVLKCVTCHMEHEPGATRKMGVTIAADFCIYCHENVDEERPTHKDLPFDGCSQCHNYHNNQALYEKFLIKHAGEKAIKSPARIAKTNYVSIYQAKQHDLTSLNVTDAKYPQNIAVSDALILAWQSDGHAKSGINCKQCHTSDNEPDSQWTNKSTVKHCQQCHEEQGRDFLTGRHGMRLKQALSAMTPGAARAPMKTTAAKKQMDCNACHGAHNFDTAYAAIDACLNCHDDEHSKNYKKSKHYTQLIQKNQPEVIQTDGVSCASCHLPRKSKRQNGLVYIYAEHNQNDNLRPSQKMARNVCIDCHSLEFSLDALADDQLVTNNFNARPTVSLGVMKMVQDNLQFNQSKRSNQ